ncbi:hypothetical protein LWI29_013617 [Acer saccharum]|uniref:Uncharacterized protein n=1 Tax=Acer saccharum TaxID=4024 RepID=A0AA39SV48_ACESA|nr:hypothetical protein LWI29_013617 [Acer saccharum]
MTRHHTVWDNLATKSKPVLEKAVQSLLKENSVPLHNVFNVADLGCAACAASPTTFSVMATVIDTTKNITCNQSAAVVTPDFQFLLNDLPGNDFNTLFKGLSKFVNGEKCEDVSCFAMVVPGLSMAGFSLETLCILFILPTVSVFSLRSFYSSTATSNCWMDLAESLHVDALQLTSTSLFSQSEVAYLNLGWTARTSSQFVLRRKMYGSAVSSFCEILLAVHGCRFFWECSVSYGCDIVLAVELGHVRIRQHVNPQSSSNIVLVQVSDWNEVYKNPTLPLMVDIGCGNSPLYMRVWVYTNANGYLCQFVCFFYGLIGTLFC